MHALSAVAEHEARVAASKQQHEAARMALNAARQRLRRRAHPELEEFHATYTHSQAVLREASAALRAARAAARTELRPVLREQHRAFLAEAQCLTRACPAHWSNSEFVLRSFLAAVSRLLAQHGGAPRPKVGLPRELHFQHRFTRGGLPVERVFSAELRVVRLERPPIHQPGHARPPRSLGSIRIAGESLPFEIRLHRPLPDGAFIKSVALVGRQNVGKGLRRCHDHAYRYLPAQWKWSLHIAVEVPSATTLSQSTDKAIAALELGYRVWGEEVRVGLLVDSTGHTEALLLPAAILKRWHYRRSLQEEADRLLEATKATLSALPVHDYLSQEARALLARLATVRAGGLWRLLQLIEHTPSEHSCVLRRWADRFTRLWREARGVEQRYLAHRNTLYRTWTLHLCQRYRKIVIKKLALKQIAEAETFEVRLQEAVKYRQLAALSWLLRALAHAAKKTGTPIVEITSALPTRTCAECGAVVTGNISEVYLTCPSGHRWDQDENSGRNLLHALAGL